MSAFKQKRFWFSLLGFGLINYLILWIYIPKFILSGNPGADGVAVSGFPFTTETYGGCAMLTTMNQGKITDGCMDFNPTHFWINLVILIILSVIVAYVFNKAKSFWGGIKNVGHYLLGWLMALMLLYAATFVIQTDGIIGLSTTWIAIITSSVYSAYYLLGPQKFPFTLQKD